MHHSHPTATNDSEPSELPNAWGTRADYHLKHHQWTLKLLSSSKYREKIHAFLKNLKLGIMDTASEQKLLKELPKAFKDIYESPTFQEKDKKEFWKQFAKLTGKSMNPIGALKMVNLLTSTCARELSIQSINIISKGNEPFKDQLTKRSEQISQEKREAQRKKMQLPLPGVAKVLSAVKEVASKTMDEMSIKPPEI